MDRGNEQQVGGNGGEDLSSESGIIVFGTGGRGCSGRGCLFWIIVSVVLSVGLTVLVNLILLLFSGGGGGINV